MTRTEATQGTVLVVGPGAAAAAPLDDDAVAADLMVERALDADAAIVRVERGELFDVVLLAPALADPVRVAQRLHSLDREGAVIVMAEPGGEADLQHALAVAPFLDGDVSMLTDAASLGAQLAAAAARTRSRRPASVEQEKRRETPPPLSARYLGTLLDSAPIGIVTLDQSGSVMGWNKQAGEMLGVPEVDALGSSFAALFGRERASVETLIAALGSSGIGEQGHVFERGGRSFELTGARFAIRSGEGGSLLILQDVTKRRAAEREVELQRALMAAQADASMVGIAVVTLDGSLERMNRRWTEIWGVDADQARRDPAAALQMMVDQVVDAEQFIAGTERLLATGDGEFRDEIALNDGRVIERYATHVRDDAGNVIGRIWFHTDITEHRRQQDALRFLADATNLLSSSLDCETTLQRVADLAVPWMASWCSVEIAEKGGHRTVAMAHAAPDRFADVGAAGRRGPETQSGPVAQVIASGEPLVVPEHAAMIVPIKLRDRVFGAINFVRSASDPLYDEEDLELVAELARRTAIAIDNSRVHAELRNTARTLQESLLPPHLPAIDGLEMAARFHAAGAGMQVGGDFYDIFEIAPDQWAIAVGDVCGKGAEAAALTALTRYTVRAAAMYERDPSGVLRVLNEALLRQRGDSRFTTLALCVVDLSGAWPALHASCGGHPRPLLLRSDGSAESVGAVGPLLGVVADAEFSDEHVELARGDVLVLYTDGLTDALAPERMLDEATLLASLAQCRELGAAEVSLRLEECALGGEPIREPRDDIALVVAKLA